MINCCTYSTICLYTAHSKVINSLYDLLSVYITFLSLLCISKLNIKNFCINSCHHFVTVTHELLLWAYFQHWGHTAAESRATFSSYSMAVSHLCSWGSRKGSQAETWPSHLVRTVRMFFPYIQHCLYMKEWVTHAATKAPHSYAPCTTLLACLFAEVDLIWLSFCHCFVCWSL